MLFLNELNYIVDSTYIVVMHKIQSNLLYYTYINILIYVITDYIPGVDT